MCTTANYLASKFRTLHAIYDNMKAKKVAPSCNDHILWLAAGTPYVVTMWSGGAVMGCSPMATLKGAREEAIKLDARLSFACTITKLVIE